MHVILNKRSVYFNIVDDDECASNPCDRNAKCTNNPGSFTCLCNNGYIGDGKTCTGQNTFLYNPVYSHR